MARVETSIYHVALFAVDDHNIMRRRHAALVGSSCFRPPSLIGADLGHVYSQCPSTAENADKTAGILPNYARISSVEIAVVRFPNRFINQHGVFAIRRKECIGEKARNDITRVLCVVT